MNISAKKTIEYILAVIILLITILSLLAIWDIVEIQDVMGKIMKSLLVIFISSVVTLFIFKVVIKDN
jgi:hypothetical protein